MGFGGATKKLQKVADMGEELYVRMNELREQIVEMRETVQETNRRVATLENQVDQQGAVLEALAESEDIDVDEILTEVAIEEAEPADSEGDGPADDADVTPDADGEGDADGNTDSDTDADEDGVDTAIGE